MIGFRMALTALLVSALPAAADTNRIGIMSAFEPEWLALQKDLQNAESQTLHGTTFVTGTLSGKEVVLFLSGVSMVNAAMTAQMALEHYEIDALVYSGIAGGINQRLNIGDVIVPENWGQWLDAVMARETDEGFVLPSFVTSPFPNSGMIFTRETTVVSDRGEPERRFWFPVDPDLLQIAERVSRTTKLASCNSNGECLDHQPLIRVGGNSVSGSAFVDNIDVRDWIDATFQAQVVDMETAAVAQVAWTNQVPFIAFRSLADLAGGGDGENEMDVFMSLASENSATVVKAFLTQLP